MYRQQSFNASNFGANAQGMNSYFPTSTQGSASLGGGAIQSQYRGSNRAFQPTGMVQSAYQGASNMSQNPQQFHAANYRGDQPAHDQDLRGDSFMPAQQGGSAYIGRTGFLNGVNPEAARAGYNQAGYNQAGGNQAGYSQAGGNQAGYRQFGGQSFGQGWSSGATSGLGSSARGGMGWTTTDGFGSAMSGLGSSARGGTGMTSTGGVGSATMGSAGSSQYQQINPLAQQFHAANYRGDQPAHDQDLRGDSFMPAQQGGSAYIGRTGFLNGVNPEAARGANQSANQFGNQSANQFGNQFGNQSANQFGNQSFGSMG